ncbi:pyocin knob domain-containing protein [Limosilactobacillus fermentum]|uniref:pyocin knob domain-containing protein n=1 Tax=Limosilactobacillus fermentum TaxID=1613 RepID=UPI002730547F|nr:pyocin knob domain-containing protein [Limosilactobacillus fermentum]WLF74795.1 pyocin knob domain-containing protein [Limosilactobacillus fermentum]
MRCVSANLEYQHYRYTFITPDTSQKVTKISVYLAHPDRATNGARDNLSGTGYFKKLKVERGEIDTPYSHAPEDTEQAFTEVNATINGLRSTVSSNHNDLQSQINQTAKNIRQEVSDKTSGLQTQITQQANSFNVSLNALRNETAWQKVTTAIDANNYTTTGNYWIQAVSNSNTPDGSAWAYLEVVAEPAVERIKQTWQRDNNANEAYTRLKTGNTWSDWQKTVTAGNIMAQINMSAGTTLIQNNKIYMDADSTIFSGKAFIPSAAISNLSADKITTGTLNAGLINVINLNASSITTGTINGANLKIDLNNGEVQFKGEG